MRIFNLFRRKVFKPEPKSLRIDGCKTVLTPKPDDAELAAQALLETRLSPDPSLGARGANSKAKNTVKKATAPSLNKEGSEESVRDASYYRQLSEKIRAAHEHDRRAAMRYVAYCEQELSSPSINREGQGVGLLERGLYQHQDAVEREGGNLKRRWQHCLAECIVRQTVLNENAADDSTTTTDNTGDSPTPDSSTSGDGDDGDGSGIE